MEIARLTERNGDGGISVADLPAAPKKLAEYEDANEQGRLLGLPVKAGDTVYQVDAERVYELKIKKLIFDTDGIAFDERAIGNSVFLTRSEAETALKAKETAQ